jgi:proteasome accessory factor C
VIVPYLVQHPGTTLAEASRLFGVEPGQLRKDLDLLFMSGLPPYGPGDLIDVEVDEDGAITIRMADHFARPLRLTRHEALAVHVRATELLATPGVPEAPALGRALERLRASLGVTGGIEADAGTEPPEALEAVRAAAADRRRIRIDYASASSGRRAWRTVEPEKVFASGGRWYVVAWDLEADAERMFRVDRAASVEVTGEVFEPRGLSGAGRPLYTPSDADTAVRLRLAPAARWVAEYYVTNDVVERDDGSIDATIPARSTGWLVRLLLRLGADAEVLEPPALRHEVHDLARRTLAVYDR